MSSLGENFFSSNVEGTEQEFVLSIKYEGTVRIRIYHPGKLVQRPSIMT